MWDLSTFEQIQRLEGHSKDIGAVAFSPDGKLLASGADDKRIIFWDTENGEQIAELEGHFDPIWSLAFSPDGKVLASASGDGTILLWEVPEIE